MQPQGLLQHSQALATCPYPQPNQYNPCLPVPIPEYPFQYSPPSYAQVF